MRQSRPSLCRFLVLAIVSGGLLLQSACGTSLLITATSLTSSIRDQFIQNLVNKTLGVDSAGSLSSLGT